MGYYIVRGDLESRFGEDNVDKWAGIGRDDTEAEKTARIDDCIDEAEAEIHDTLRGKRYTIPLSGASYSLPTIRLIATQLAGYSLYAIRGLRDTDDDNKYVKQATEARNKLRRIAAKEIVLDANLNHDGPTAPQPLG